MKMKLPELAATLNDLLTTLSSIVSDRRALAQQLVDAATKAQADAEKIAALESQVSQLTTTNTDLVANDAATDAEQAAAITAEYEGKLKEAQDALAASVADEEAATASIATVVGSISQLVAN